MTERAGNKTRLSEASARQIKRAKETAQESPDKIVITERELIKGGLAIATGILGGLLIFGGIKPPAPDRTLADTGYASPAATETATPTTGSASASPEASANPSALPITSEIIINVEGCGCEAASTATPNPTKIPETSTLTNSTTTNRESNPTSRPTPKPTPRPTPEITPTPLPNEVNLPTLPMGQDWFVPKGHGFELFGDATIVDLTTGQVIVAHDSSSATIAVDAVPANGHSYEVEAIVGDVSRQDFPTSDIAVMESWYQGNVNTVLQEGKTLDPDSLNLLPK